MATLHNSICYSTNGAPGLKAISLHNTVTLEADISSYFLFHSCCCRRPEKVTEDLESIGEKQKTEFPIRKVLEKNKIQNFL